MLLASICMMFILCCCSPCYYVPNAPNVPFFKEKNNAGVSFSYQLGNISSGVNLQAAYALTDHLGLMMNFNYFGGRQESVTFFGMDEEVRYNGNMLEFGAGYFLPVKTNFVFETYAGMGFGGVENNSTFYPAGNRINNHVRFRRYFVQPAFGWIANEHFLLGLSVRTGMLHYYDLNIKTGDDTDIYALMDIKNNPSFVVEPALTMRTGGEIVKFQLQMITSYLIDSKYANYDPYAIVFGLYFNIRGKAAKP